MKIRRKKPQPRKISPDKERQRVLQRACDFLSGREHSRQELRHKLKRHCDDTELIEAVISTLATERLQSDRRFTMNFVSQGIGKGQGPYRIRRALEERGIDKELIHHALITLADDWLPVARKAREKKFGTGLPDNTQDKAKQFRFLRNRGFSIDQINQVLGSSVDS